MRQRTTRPALPASPTARLVRRHLLALRREIARAGARAAAGSPVALHDWRVAVRRWRALLRAAREPLAGTAAERLAEQLDRMSTALGGVRDMDVWLAFLQRQQRPAGLDAPAWRRLLRTQQQQARRRRRTCRTLLRSARYRAVLAQMDRFLESELAPALDRAEPGPVRPWARRILRQAWQRAARQRRRCRRFAMDEAHALRIACRRARYLADFFAPLLGKPTRRWAARLKDLQQTLGEIHDLDVGLERLAAPGLQAARPLARRMRARRRRKARRARRLWAQLDRRMRERAPFASEP